MPIKNINAICRVDGRVRLYPVKEEEEEVKNFARHAFKSADLENRERNPSIRVLRGREGGEKGRREKKRERSDRESTRFAPVGGLDEDVY